MSRVGKKPIKIPAGVEVKIEGQKVMVKSPKGELTKEFRPEIGIEMKEGNISLFPKIESKNTMALWGTSRALIMNMINGLTVGFEKKLQIEGVGYKASLEGADLNLSLGFTHPVKIKAPAGIKFSVEKNIITISGFDKELVGQTASKIRKIRPPEPYKGKGIRYLGEIVKIKPGKKVVTAGGATAAA